MDTTHANCVFDQRGGGSLSLRFEKKYLRRCHRSPFTSICGGEQNFTYQSGRKKTNLNSEDHLPLTVYSLRPDWNVFPSWLKAQLSPLNNGNNKDVLTTQYANSCQDVNKQSGSNFQAQLQDILLEYKSKIQSGLSINIIYSYISLFSGIYIGILFFPPTRL